MFFSASLLSFCQYKILDHEFPISSPKEKNYFIEVVLGGIFILLIYLIKIIKSKSIHIKIKQKDQKVNLSIK